MQQEWRTMWYEYNGMPPGFYTCFDDLKDLKERGNEHCNNVGLWKSGTGAFMDAINWYLTLEDQQPDYNYQALKWSDELALSAGLYVKEFEGCSVW